MARVDTQIAICDAAREDAGTLALPPSRWLTILDST
jgi:hypothetical protein